MKNVEIMSPAGSFASLHAAIKGGANSVYFGVEQLNMRAKSSNNFKITDLSEIIRIAKENNVKTYLTVNTVLYDHDISLMHNICDKAKECGVDAIIACDIAAMSYAHEKEIEIHVSTQQNVSNIEAVKFFAKFADVIVLARELTLKQIEFIIKKIQEDDIRGPKGNLVEIELFAHGALCVAISGKCHMSLATENSSANRGACVQNCRRSYRVIDEETGDELVIDNKYVMSPKDLCTIGFLDKLIASGVSVLKLEGRGRSPDYVYTITKCYREAADAVLNGTYTEEKIAEWTRELESVYNRGFWHGGYYLGKQLGEWSGVYGSKATTENIYIGRATNYFRKTNIAEFTLETGEITAGETLLIVGDNSGVIKVQPEIIYVDGAPSNSAKKGDVLTISVPERVRMSDKIFVVRTRK